MMENSQKTVAIVQSCYIPWKGFFDIIQSVDEFILYDDVQFTKRDWRNRNTIKTPQGLKWLTIPVQVKGKYHQKILDVKVNDKNWADKHWTSIKINYNKAKYFKDYENYFVELYEIVKHEEFLSKINYLFIKSICEFLSIKTKISFSTDYAASGSKTERLISLCKATAATCYLTGPKAKDYIDLDLFIQNNLKLIYMSYEGYPCYLQLHGEYVSNVTILDLIFNVGPDANMYIKKLAR